MSLWFSASAAVPHLVAHGQMPVQQASLLTGAVQLGFVAGTLVSAMLGLADRLDPRRFFAASALVGSVANAGILAVGLDHPLTVVLRFITGLAMAGVYPVGLKMAAAWAERNMGLMMGMLVGALSLGSALPHLFTSLPSLMGAGDADARTTLMAASACGLAAALAIGGVQLGPRHGASPRFVPSQVTALLRQPALLWANAGYLGHMWELYAMWAWIGSFMAWASAGYGSMAPAMWGIPALSTFCVIAAGAVGCLCAGVLADRVGRTAVTMAAMVCSGTCAATIGWWVGVGPVALMAVALLWGFSAVADSAQFSASIAELSPPHLVGTALTVQTSLGFLLTFFVIQAMPWVVDHLGWSYAFIPLAVGPYVGVWAMWRLRQRPEAVGLAHGRR